MTAHEFWYTLGIALLVASFLLLAGPGTPAGRKISCKLGHHKPGTDLGPDKSGRDTALCVGCGTHLTKIHYMDEY